MASQRPFGRRIAWKEYACLSSLSDRTSLSTSQERTSDDVTAQSPFAQTRRARRYGPRARPAGHRDPDADPGACYSAAAGGAGCHRPVAHRLRQDDRLRTAARRAHRSRLRQVQALVLVPTRELASQVADVLASLDGGRGLRVAQLIGGRPLEPQRQALLDGRSYCRRRAGPCAGSSAPGQSESACAALRRTR